MESTIAPIRQVPELSLKKYLTGNESDKKEFIDSLFEGLKDYGFIILKDHSINHQLCQKAYELAKNYFALPESTKTKYISPSGGGQRGHTPFGKEHAKDSSFFDLKEFFHVGRDIAAAHELKSIYPDNIWPNEIIEFQNVFTELYQSFDFCSNVILEALGEALKVPENYFTNLIKDGNSILRTIHYPPLSNNNYSQQHVRAAAHEDINLITILIAATTSGLELLDRNGKWLAVETSEGNLIVDSGDMLSRITNGVIPATTHRVVNPPVNDFSARYSMPYFVHPHPKAMLECLPSCIGEGEKFPPILSHDFLMDRLKAIGLFEKEKKQNY